MASPTNQHSLILLIGPAGSGKSTYAREKFPHDWIVSSDHCRRLIYGTEDYMEGRNDEVFQLYRSLISDRLSNGLSVVADSTGLWPIARVPLLEMANKSGAHKSVVIFSVTPGGCIERDRQRDRVVGERIIRHQFADYEKSLDEIQGEDFDAINFVEVDPHSLKQDQGNSLQITV